MKTILLILSVLITTQAFAFDICAYQETSELALTEIGRSQNPKRFTFAEKNLIHRTVTQQSFYEGITKVEALDIFNQRSSDGEIIYYEVDGVEVTLVHYYPGDNEYGAFYRGSKLIARVGDSFISCIEE